MIHVMCKHVQSEYNSSLATVVTFGGYIHAQHFMHFCSLPIVAKNICMNV